MLGPRVFTPLGSLGVPSKVSLEGCGSPLRVTQSANPGVSIPVEGQCWGSNAEWALSMNFSTGALAELIQGSSGLARRSHSAELEKLHWRLWSNAQYSEQW